MIGGVLAHRSEYILVSCPPLPFAVFNGIWVDNDSMTAELGHALAEVERMGLPAGVQLRTGRSNAVEYEVRRLGLSRQSPLAGMAATIAEFRISADPPI